jgi:hypothetical protein
MATWNDSIQEMKNSLGLCEGTARSATADMLQMVRKQAGEEKIPGADRLLQDAPAEESEGKKGWDLSKPALVLSPENLSGDSVAGLLGSEGSNESR